LETSRYYGQSQTRHVILALFLKWQDDVSLQIYIPLAPFEGGIDDLAFARGTFLPKRNVSVPPCTWSVPDFLSSRLT